jgi:hypothetical protein
MDVSLAYQQEQLHVEFQDPDTDETRLWKACQSLLP